VSALFKGRVLPRFKIFGPLRPISAPSPRGPDYVIILLGGIEGARPLVAFLGGEALKKAKAGDLVKELGHVLNGSGGGKPEMASGQVKTSKGFEEAVKSIEGKLA